MSSGLLYRPIRSALPLLAATAANRSMVPWGFDMPVNAGLSQGVSAGVLTVSLTNPDQTGPTPYSPVLIPFRDAGDGSGSVVWRTITSPLSISTVVGASFQVPANMPFRLWVVAIDDPSNNRVVLGLLQTLFQSGSIFVIQPLDESILRTSVAMSASATSAAQIYTPAGVTCTNCRIRILGYLEIPGQATPGTFTGVSKIQPYSPGIKNAGDRGMIWQVGSGVGVVENFTTTNTWLVSGNLQGNVGLNSPASVIHGHSTCYCSSTLGTNATLYMLNSRGNTSASGFFGSQAATTSTSNGTLACTGWDRPGSAAGLYSAQFYFQTGSSGTATFATGILLIEEIYT